MFEYRVREKNVGKPVAVVLGGTVPHAELILKLKERGFYTVVIDYFDNPPAAAVADVHCHESAMDYEVVRDVAKENGAAVILSSCLDQQMNIAMKAAEELGLPHPFSSELVERVTNKKLMKRIMMEGGIPTSKYYVVGEDTVLDDLKLSYPVIVKPVDSCGSAGVLKIMSATDLPAAVQESVKWSRDGKAIVEEFVDGTEMSVHCYIKDGHTVLNFASCKIVSMLDGIYQQQINVYFPELKSALKKELERVGDLIVDKFGLPPYTPMFMQIIVNNGKASVIEFSPRIAGGIARFVSERYRGFDILNYSIDSYFGQRTECSKPSADSLYVANVPIYCREGVFDKVTGCEDLIREGTILKVEQLKLPGDHIDLSKPSSSNALKCVVEGKTPLECFEKALLVKKNVCCFDRNGVDMTDRSHVLTRETFESKVAELL